MLLIREIYESIPPNSRIILSCNHKIIYNTEQNLYCFYYDLVAESIGNKKILAIAQENSEIIFTIYFNEMEFNRLLELNPQLVIHDLRRAFTAMDAELFKLISRSIELSAWLNESSYCGVCAQPTTFSEKEMAFAWSCSNNIFYRFRFCLISRN